jgi:predicted aspartyl protease
MPPPYRGQFNQKGLPLIEIEVVGEGGSEKIFAVIDSGYNGFLSVTYPIAASAKLEQLGVESAALANGDPVTYLECLGTVVLGNIRVKVVIDVQEKGRILLGNAFLKEARLCFKCDPFHSLAEIDYLKKD